MTDELFMRGWTTGHSRFSADIEGALIRLRRGAGRYARDVVAIGTPYGAITRGAIAGMITLGLWSTVMALATPAPGFAADYDELPAGVHRVGLA